MGTVAFRSMESHSECHCEAAASPAQQPRDTRWGRRRSLVFFVGGAVLGLVLLLALATGQGGGRSETTLFQQMLDYSPDIVVQPLAGTKYCTGNCVGKYMFTAKGADYSGASPSKPLDMDALAKKYIQALHGKPPDADAPSARKVNTKLADRQSDDTSEEDATEMHPKVGIFDTPRRFREGLSKHWTAI